MALLPLTNAQRVERFGRFDFKPAPRPSNPEAIAVIGDWVARNIVSVRCPQLERFFDVDSVRLHRLAKQPFLDLWQAWDDDGLIEGRIKTWDGALALRYKRGRAGGGFAALSSHAQGTAFDIDARLYPLGARVAADAPCRALQPAAERLGWFWGGLFKSRCDGMHREYVGIAPPLDEHEAARRLLHEKLTRAEVRAAQAVLGLQADGLIGEKTRTRARAVLGVS